MNFDRTDTTLVVIDPQNDPVVRTHLGNRA